MDRTSQIPANERCAEHNLAIGPAGECVLCRRARIRPAGRPRWLGPALLAAGLGTTLLGGVALARTHAPLPPVAEAAPVEVSHPVLAPPIEARPTTAAAPPVEEPRPCVPAAPQPLPPPVAVPQRNYLDEAYAAMPKGNLYDEGPGHVGHQMTTATGCPCRKLGCQPHYYYGGLSRTAANPVGTPRTPTGSVPVQAASPPPSYYARGAVSRR